MNIKQRRLQNLIEQVLKEELQRGNLPSSREFIQRINDGIYGNKLEQPTLKIKPVRQGGTASADDVNRVVEQAHEDLTMLYQSVIGKYDSALKNFNKFDVQKGKLDYELNKMENQLRELILLYKESGFITSVYDVFDDLSKVDTGATTAEVDIKSHEVSLMHARDTSHKIPTDNAFASFTLTKETKDRLVSRSSIGQTSYGLSDAIDEAWAEMLYLSSNHQVVEGIYEVDLKGVHPCNNIEIDLHSGKEIRLTLEYSPNGTTWRPLPFSEEEEKAEGVKNYSFNSVNIQKFRIKMKKTESDHSSTVQNSTSQSVVYGYLLGIRKLSFLQTGYAEYGELHSKPLSPITKEGKVFTINQVSLHADEFAPNGTTIDYFVAMNKGIGQAPEWKAISPVNKENPKHDQIIDFKNIAQSPAETYLVDPNISTGEYRLESLYANGINFYRLGDIEGRKLIEGTEQLYAGKDSWGVKSYPYTHPANHIPSLADWERPNGHVTEVFKKIVDGKAGSLLESEQKDEPTNYMFTLGIFSRKGEETISAIPLSLEPLAIYMNGEKIFEGVPVPGTKVNYLFKPGWNEIKVLTYLVNTVGTTEGAVLSLGFDPREYGAYTYAKARSMEKVSLFDLRYNVKSNDTNKYAIMETNGRYTIVLNHIVSGLEYDFYSQYIDGEPQTEILFKAVMKLDRNATAISPKLKSYRLRFS